MLDIQKLAAEMGLTCITTYKLDALKAVCQRNESNDIATIQSCKSSFHEEKMSLSTAEDLNADKAYEETDG